MILPRAAVRAIGVGFFLEKLPLNPVFSVAWKEKLFAGRNSDDCNDFVKCSVRLQTSPNGRVRENPGTRQGTGATGAASPARDREVGRSPLQQVGIYSRLQLAADADTLRS
jgi:hypothetical protein